MSFNLSNRYRAWLMFVAYAWAIDSECFAWGENDVPADFRIVAVFQPPASALMFVGPGYRRVRTLTIEGDGRCRLDVEQDLQGRTLVDKFEFKILRSDLAEIWKTIVKEEFSRLKPIYDVDDIGTGFLILNVAHDKKSEKVVLVAPYKEELHKPVEKRETIRFLKIWDAVNDIVPTRLLSKYREPFPSPGLPDPTAVSSVLVTLYDLEKADGPDGPPVKTQVEISDPKIVSEILECLQPAISFGGIEYTRDEPCLGKLEFRSKGNKTVITFYPGPVKHMFYRIDGKEYRTTPDLNKELRLALRKRYSGFENEAEHGIIFKVKLAQWCEAETTKKRGGK